MAQECTARTDRADGLSSARRLPRSADPRRRSAPLDPRNNSLNLIRLLLAVAVLVSHTFPLSGQEHEPGWAGESLGGWAVIGFFTVSGYLIAGARLRSEGGRYLINRIARIMPGFLVSLLVVAFGFAPLAYAVERGTLDGFLTTPTTPLDHLFSNALLDMQAYGVAGTLSGVPYPGDWNGSLWSLYFEFLCYIVVGVVATVPVVRRQAWPLVTLFLASVVVHAQIARFSVYLGGDGDFVMLMKLLPYFLGGAVLFVLKERLPLRWQGALPALVVALGVVAWQPAWGGQLAAPLFTYVLLWAAAAVPSPRWIRINDLSYGVYIYAFPVTQLLALAGLHGLGLVPFTAAIVAGTLVLAGFSWFFVERPARDLVARASRTDRTAPPGTQPEGPATAPTVPVQRRVPPAVAPRRDADDATSPGQTLR
ncbi:MAG TPA: acyltransferase [Blastococcus sp.]|nr:acyltransferase [Blastococcus sp.]